jgi:pimeloyl-ACP methyl ester carboxylesterase
MVITIISTILLIIIAVLVARNSGKPKPFLDENGKVLAGSISEKIHVRINGVDQGMFIKSRDSSNPVLLFVHGGPAMPEYFLSLKKPTGLENHFTVCWWEQRGSGLSYNPSIPSSTFTSEQLVSDIIEVTRYLRKRFGKEKIYLFAHSWGSYIGIQAAALAPKLYYAYIGMGQVAYQFQSEKIAYSYMIDQYSKNGNKRILDKLLKIPLNELDTMPQSYRAIRDDAMHTLGVGTTHSMRSVVKGVFLPVLQCSDYTIAERINIWRGKWSLNSTLMWNRMMETKLNEKITKLEVPVYFFHGKHDYTICHSLTKSYFESLQAPIKGFYTFGESAHSPLFEEPEKVLKIMQSDVMSGTNNLADSK